MSGRIVWPVVAVVALAISCTSSRPAGDRAAPSRSYVGQGTLVIEAGEPARLCALMYTPTGELASSCLFGIEVAGIDVAELPTARSENGLTVVDDVRLVGTWDGTTLTVSHVPEVATTRPPSSTSTQSLPACPDDGAEDPPSIPEDFDAWKSQSDALDEFGRQNPELYAGRWASDGSTVEQVVALTDDSEANRAAVAAIYPWACVVHRPNSENDLLNLQAELQLARLPNGNRVIGSGTDPVASTLDIIVLVRDDVTEQWLADRYGDRVAIESAALLEPL
jgi:hypothetical protein